MPYYRISIKLKNGNHLSGIREMDNRDVDYAWKYFEARAYEKFGEFAVTGFNLIMLSKLSQEVKAYIRKEKKPPRIQGWNEQFE